MVVQRLTRLVKFKENTACLHSFTCIEAVQTIKWDVQMLKRILTTRRSSPRQCKQSPRLRKWSQLNTQHNHGHYINYGLLLLRTRSNNRRYSTFAHGLVSVGDVDNAANNKEINECY